MNLYVMYFMLCKITTINVYTSKKIKSSISFMFSGVISTFSSLKKNTFRFV